MDVLNKSHLKIVLVVIYLLHNNNLYSLYILLYLSNLEIISLIAIVIMLNQRLDACLFLLIKTYLRLCPRNHQRWQRGWSL